MHSPTLPHLGTMPPHSLHASATAPAPPVINKELWSWFQQFIVEVKQARRRNSAAWADPNVADFVNLGSSHRKEAGGGSVSKPASPRLNAVHRSSQDSTSKSPQFFRSVASPSSPNLLSTSDYDGNFPTTGKKGSSSSVPARAGSLPTTQPQLSLLTTHFQQHQEGRNEEVGGGQQVHHANSTPTTQSPQPPTTPFTQNKIRRAFKSAADVLEASTKSCGSMRSGGIFSPTHTNNQEEDELDATTTPSASRTAAQYKTRRPTPHSGGGESKLATSIKAMRRPDLEVHMEKAVRLIFQLIKDHSLSNELQSTIINNSHHHPISHPNHNVVSESTTNPLSGGIVDGEVGDTGSPQMCADVMDTVHCSPIHSTLIVGDDDNEAATTFSSPFATNILSDNNNEDDDDLMSTSSFSSEGYNRLASPLHHHHHNRKRSLKGGNRNSDASVLGLTSSILPTFKFMSKSVEIDDLMDSGSLSHTIHFVQHKALQKERDSDGNKILNGYVFMGSIGAGAYGKVRLAYERGNQHKKYAVKTVPKSISRRMGQPQRMDHFMKEIAIMKALRHKNIVALHAVVDDPEAEKVYMVMDYIEGGNLLEEEKCPSKVAEGYLYQPLPEASVVKYMRQLVGGVRYLHKHRIAHRDIKPNNILRSNADDTVFIADFGTSELGTYLTTVEDLNSTFSATVDKSALGDETPPGSPAAAVMITDVEKASCSFELESSVERRPLVVFGQKGTPMFWSPEMFRAADREYFVDGEAQDTWALGVTLYMMLTGKSPFKSTKLFDLKEEIGGPEEVSIPHTLSIHAQSLLRSMLHKNQRDRCTLLEVRSSPFLFVISGEKLQLSSSGSPLQKVERNNTNGNHPPSSPILSKPPTCPPILDGRDGVRLSTYAKERLSGYVNKIRRKRQPSSLSTTPFQPLSASSTAEMGVEDDPYSCCSPTGILGSNNHTPTPTMFTAQNNRKFRRVSFEDETATQNMAPLVSAASSSTTLCGTISRSLRKGSH